MFVKYRRLLRQTIGAKIFFSMALMTLFSMVLIVYAIYSTYSESMRENEIKYNILATNTIKTKFDMTIELVSSTAETLLNNQVFVDFITQKNQSLHALNETAGTLQNIQAIQPFIESVHTINQNATVYSSRDLSVPQRDDGTYRSLWNQAQSNHQGGFWSIQGISIRYIYPIQRDGKLEALIAMDINYDYLREMFMLSAIQLNEKVLVADAMGNTLFHYPHFTSFDPFLQQYPDILRDDTVRLEGKVYGIDSIIYAEKLRLADWRIIRIIQTDLITIQTQRVIRSLSLAGGAVLLVCLIYSLWMTRSLTRPIKILDNACAEVERGNMDVRVVLDTPNEFGTLARTINMMLNQVQAHLETMLLEEKQKSEMQFEILQAQVNPHFLYNTLDSIRWLAELKNISSIAEMSTSLIQLLKYNLTSSTRATTLREELESVRNYITIQKFRYSDSFDFSIRADEDALDCEVVRFILQPLVENSILHGFEDSSERYSICISAFFSEEQLHIKVIDNGAGMNRDQMREINDAQWNRYRFNRIGVANIRKRIKLYFGDTYDVRYDSVPNVGTIAEIVLPIRRRGQSCAPEQPLS